MMCALMPSRRHFFRRGTPCPLSDFGLKTTTANWPERNFAEPSSSSRAVLTRKPSSWKARSNIRTRLPINSTRIGVGPPRPRKAKATFGVRLAAARLNHGDVLFLGRGNEHGALALDTFHFLVRQGRLHL